MKCNECGRKINPKEEEKFKDYFPSTIHKNMKDKIGVKGYHCKKCVDFHDSSIKLDENIDLTLELMEEKIKPIDITKFAKVIKKKSG